MSEYQYYEFQAVDRPLSRSEQEEISRLSSRVQLNPRQAIFVYNFSSFRGNPEEVLRKYYDAMFYLANWGTTQLLFRFPRTVVNVADLEPYCIAMDDFTGYETGISGETFGEYVVLNIAINEEPTGEWLEGEGILSGIIGLREAILQGDYRCLYLAWLRMVQFLDTGTKQFADEELHSSEEEWDEEEWDEDGDWDDFEERDDLERQMKLRLEPPVPAGLDNLTPDLEQFVALLELNQDLLAAAVEASPQAEDTQPFEEWVPLLPEQERLDFLVRLAQNEVGLSLLLQKRLRELSPSDKVATTPMKQRTIGDLLDGARVRRQKRIEQERLVAERAQRLKMEELARREHEVWDDVIRLIEVKKVQAYDHAMELMRELRALALYQGRMETFQRRIEEICRDYSRLSSLMSKIGKLERE